MVRGIHHVQIAIPIGGEGAADAFYGDLLGLERVPKPRQLAARGGRWFRIPGSDVEVHLGTEESFTPARKAHLALVVDDLGAVRRALAEHGFAIVDDAQIEGYERFYTSDPFGNRVEILAAARAT
jgi:catechol 2,3-dioxygenase-like lactoylglutathione lyase family enzyme